MAGAKGKAETSPMKSGATIALLIVVFLLVVRPWKLRWTVERALPEPVVISQDASLSRVEPLLKNVRPVAKRALEELRPQATVTTAAKPAAKGAIDQSVFRASFTDSTNFLVGYKDSSGVVVIPARFEWGGSFENGLAKVEQDGKFGVIDLNGQYVIAPEFESIFDFVDGIAVAQKDGWFFFIDQTGRPVSDDRFDYAWPHKDGMALVKKDGLFGYADAQGRLAVAPTLEETFGYNEGLAVAKVNGQYGLIDRRGRFAVMPQYDYAWPVDRGSALVRKNGETTTIDVSRFTESTTK